MIGLFDYTTEELKDSVELYEYGMITYTELARYMEEFMEEHREEM